MLRSPRPLAIRRSCGSTSWPRKNGVKANLLAKLEFFNPIASVKDRIGVAMIEALEAQGKITPGKTTLIEPTSGNTGIALAFAAAAKGYKLILTMPETMSIERRKMLALLGAELVLTEGPKGMKGAIAKAEELAASLPGRDHSAAVRKTRPIRKSTARRPPRKSGTTTDGSVDILVSGIGTGGTITGAGQVLKGKKTVDQGDRRRAGRIACALRRRPRPA